MLVRGVVVLVVSWTLLGCSAPQDADQAASAGGAAPVVSLDQAVETLEALAPVDKVVPVPRKNAPRGMLGLEDLTYVGGVVAYDRRLSCRGVTLACGVEVEVWGSAGEASARSGFVKALEMGMTGLGAERHFLNDAMLVRVSQRLSDQQARRYAEALGAVPAVQG